MLSDLNKVYSSFPAGYEVWRDNPIEALERLYNTTTGFAECYIAWYDNKASIMGRLARLIRISALVLVGIGSTAPLTGPQLASVTQSMFGIVIGTYSTQVGFIALAIAALLISIDNFSNYSLTWMRYRLTEAELRRRLDNFHYDWVAKLAAVSGQSPSPQQQTDMIKLNRDFVDAIGAAVERETSLWAESLRTRLEAMDQQVKTTWERRNQPPASSSSDVTTPPAKPGTLVATVCATPAADANSEVMVSLDQGAPRKADASNMVAFKEVAPGVHTLKAEIKRNGQPATKEVSVTVLSEKTIESTIEIS